MINEQAHGDFMHPVALGEGECHAHKASEPLTQGVVPAFDVAGLAFAFIAQAMGAPRKNLVVRQPKVTAGGTAAIIGWDALAQSTGAFSRTVADEVGNHLAGLAAKRNPNPAGVSLGTDKAPEFIQFQHVALFCGQKRVAQRREACGFFSSHLAMVWRATPKTRSAARRPNRSTSTARRISALRSGSMAGLLAWSTRCAPQALQRYCWVPEPLWPALTMEVLAHVAQQGAEVFHARSSLKESPLSLNHQPSPTVPAG